MHCVVESGALQVTMLEWQCLSMGLVSVAITQRQVSELCVGDVMRMNDTAKVWVGLGSVEVV